MAEAVLDEEHPLADYLLDAGDAPAELMPGGAAEFLVVEADTDTNIWLPPFIHPLVETVHEMTQSHRSRSAAREFAERFKYVIISSSLLSSTLAPPASATIRPQPRSSSPLPPTPGKWNDPQLAVGRPESISLWTISLCIAPAALLQGYYIGALLILATARLYETNGMADSTRQASLLQNLEALDSLIAAGNFWDSVVCEAMSILEKEERTLFYGTATPGSPSSNLRVALHSTLQTTTTQCDNVRQLFSPLTSQAELAQMTEMYAPLTPLKATFSAHSTNFFDNPRPLSLSGSPSHWVPPSSAGPSTPTPMADKRATWNGQQQMIKDRRRSALATLLGEHASPMAKSQPPTPRAFDDDEPFGVTALDLTRNKRRSLRLTGTGGYSTPISATGSSSRFTAMQTTRHPLSLSSLNHALQAAMSSKRYSASHLLALRFGEEEEEYWEDVRSVVSLLTTTLEDAASRLSEALEESVRKQRLEEDEPLSTPLTQQAGGILSYSDSPSLARTFSLRKNMHQRGSARGGRGGITASTSLSFAPMPSRLLKFSSHVDAIASALDIAKERLQECMTALQEEQTRAQLLAQSGEEPTEGEDGPSRADLESAARAALESYENVRRELGFALRECERAREPLWDVVGVKASLGADEGDTPDLVRDVEEDGDEDDVPALAHDSSDSEPSRGSRGTVDLAYLASALAAAGPSSTNDHDHHMDDFAPLPPATGLEQVFEADSAPVGAFNRERSKMTREERIAAAKAKRDSGIGGSGSREVASTMGGHGEVWGPGGEVVQELRDVIWKVGEKRRKVQEEHQQSTLLESAVPQQATTTNEPATTSSMLRNRPRAPTRSVPAAPSQSIGSEAETQLGKLRSMVSQAERGLGISIPSPVTPSTPYATTSAGGLTVASAASPYTPASSNGHGVGGPSIEDLRAMVASVASKATTTSPLIVEPTEDVFGPTASTSSAPIDIISTKAQRRYSRQPVVGVAASPTGSGPRVSFSRPLSGSYAAAYSAAYSTGSQSPSASSSASFGSPLGSPSAAYNTLPSISSAAGGVGAGVRHRTSNSSLSSFLRTVHLEPIPDPEGDEEETFEEASEVLLEVDEEEEGQVLGVAL